MPPPGARMSHSQSLQNISVDLGDKLAVRDSKVPSNYMLNDSIITVNHDGFRANIMREDLLADQGKNKFVSFDTEAQSVQEVLDGQHNNSQALLKVEDKIERSPDREPMSTQCSQREGQDQSPEAGTDLNQSK